MAEIGPGYPLFFRVIHLKLGLSTANRNIGCIFTRTKMIFGKSTAPFATFKCRLFSIISNFETANALAKAFAIFYANILHCTKCNFKENRLHQMQHLKYGLICKFMSICHFYLIGITKKELKSSLCPQDIHRILANYPQFYEIYPQSRWFYQHKPSAQLQTNPMKTTFFEKCQLHYLQPLKIQI